MAEASIDVLMRVVGPGGPMAAESSTQFRDPTGKDELTRDFNLGFFCELKEFNFSAGAEDSLSSGEAADKNKQAAAGQKNVPAGSSQSRTAAVQPEKRKTGSATGGAGNKAADMQPVEFTRVMDSMTVPLFAALINCETLPILSVVKRKAANARQSGDGYLRLDFENVLITSLQWRDSEHLMIESGEFIYRKVTIRYRPQGPDGKLGVAVSKTWEMKTAAST